jgi:FtsZ-binding cell division protein ZapB
MDAETKKLLLEIEYLKSDRDCLILENEELKEANKELKEKLESLNGC